jgi:hypothetical protein
MAYPQDSTTEFRQWQGAPLATLLDSFRVTAALPGAEWNDLWQ